MLRQHIKEYKRIKIRAWNIMQLAKSGHKPRNWIKDMIWIAFGVFTLAILVIFFQNFEKVPQQTTVTKEIKIK